MTYAELAVDAEIYLAFYVFGLVSGLFVSWVEERAKEK